jgi:hypothetical protein
VDRPPGELVEADVQLLFYAFGWALERDEMPAQVEAVSVKTGERFSTVPSSRDVQAVSSDIARMVNDIRNAWSSQQSLERHGGPRCRYCPILEECAEGRATTALLG